MNFGWANKEFLLIAKNHGADFCDISLQDRRTGLQYQMDPPPAVKTIIEFYKFDRYGRLGEVNLSCCMDKLLNYPIRSNGKKLFMKSVDTFEIEGLICDPQSIYLSDCPQVDLNKYSYEIAETYFKLCDQISKAKNKDDSDFLKSIWEAKFDNFLVPAEINLFLKHAIRNNKTSEISERLHFAITEKGSYQMPPIAIASSGGDIKLVRPSSPYEVEQAIQESYKNMYQRGGGMQVNNPMRTVIINPNP